MNWLETLLIALSSIMLFHYPMDCNLEKKRIAAALLILISWSVLYTMLVRHPKFTFLNVYFTMFAKVGWTFIKFLLCYGIFIVAFALGFHILLNKDLKTSKKVTSELAHEHENDTAHSHATDSTATTVPTDTKFPYYNNIGSSLFITFSMLVGELYLSDSPVDTPYGYLMFVASFVFIIVMVMMNLLNGLAVRDIREIKNKAKIYAYKTQVETLATYEAMLLGDPFRYLSKGRISKASLGYLSFLNSFRWFQMLNRFFEILFGKLKQRRFAPFVRRQIQKIPMTRNNLLFSYHKKFGKGYSAVLYPNIYKMHLVKNGQEWCVYVPPELSMAAKQIAVKHQLNSQLKPKSLTESLRGIENAIANIEVSVEKNIACMYRKKLMEIETRLMAALNEKKIINGGEKIETKLDQIKKSLTQIDINVQGIVSAIQEIKEEDPFEESNTSTSL